MIPLVLEESGGSERVFDIYSRLLRERIIFLGEQVTSETANRIVAQLLFLEAEDPDKDIYCLLYTSPSPRDTIRSRMPSSASRNNN